MEHMGFVFAGGKIDQAMLGKLLAHDGLFSATYDRVAFLRDLRQVADAQGLEKLVNEGALLSCIPNFHRGALYELQSAVAIKNQVSGSNITFLRKLSKTAEGVTDIDFIIDGVYYQAKSGWSGETTTKTLAWIARAKAEGATTIKYVCPGGEAMVPPRIKDILNSSDPKINPLGAPIQMGAVKVSGAMAGDRVDWQYLFGAETLTQQGGCHVPT